MSHTPGPWFRDTIANEEGMTDADMRSVTDADANEIALVAAGDNRDANADLIAAAPDLLEALKALMQTNDRRANWKEVRQACRAAIAKAEGKS